MLLLSTISAVAFGNWIMLFGVMIVVAFALLLMFMIWLQRRTHWGASAFTSTFLFSIVLSGISGFLVWSL